MDSACSWGASVELINCANPSAQFLSYQDEIESAVLRVLRSDRYILGREVEQLETEFARYIGVNYAVGVANGTDALEISMRALGIGVGDEVITVSHTAVATVAAIEATGALPVLVDVDPDYYTLDPLQLQEVISKKTKAVIAVHLYGQPADLNLIEKFCKEHNLFLIEDVSQAHGAKLNGKRLGSIGNIACFSCYPTKNLGAIGDAGLICVNDINLAEKVRMLREYGWRKRYISDLAGRNSRLDELQASILRVKLKYLDLANSKRRIIADQYSKGLSKEIFDLPAIRQSAEHVFHLYVAKTKHQSHLIDWFKAHNIYVGVHYPVPIHLQPAYEKRIHTAESMEITERLASSVISLPIYPELSMNDVDRIIDVANQFPNG